MADSLPVDSNGASIGATLMRAIDLAQRVATDEVRLLHLESQEKVREIARRSAWVAAGILCLVLAWTGISAAIVVALEPYFSLPARLGILAALQATLGAVLVAIGVRGFPR